LDKSKNLNFLSLENIEALSGQRCNVQSFLASLVMLVPRQNQFSVLCLVLMGDISKRMLFKYIQNNQKMLSFQNIPYKNQKQNCKLVLSGQ